MTVNEIRTELTRRIGAVENEPALTVTGRFVRGEDVSMAELSADLGKTDGCADLAAAALRAAS